MIICRFLAHGEELWGEVIDDRISEIEYSLGTDPKKKNTPRSWLLGDVQILLPTKSPTHIVGVALNFPGVANSNKNTRPSEPLFFLKSPKALTDLNAPIQFPASSPSVLWGEVELACVIGKSCHKAKKENALDYVLGFTVANDLTQQNLEGRDHHLFRSKGQSGFCPISPYLSTDFDPTRGELRSYINNNMVQNGNLSEMHFSVAECIEMISGFVQLDPGDVILFGTPEGAGADKRTGIKPNDIFTCEIENLGNFKQTVVQGSENL